MSIREKVIGCSFLAIAVALIFWRIGVAFALSASDWAAWVQAIGSIAAIAAGFAVAIYQQRAHQIAQNDKRVIDRIDVLRSFYEIGLFAKAHVMLAMQAFEGSVRDVELYYRVDVGPSELLAVANVIDRAPLHELPGTEVFVHLTRVRIAASTAAAIIEKYRPSYGHTDAGRAAAVKLLRQELRVVEGAVEHLQKRMSQEANFGSSPRVARVAFQDMIADIEHQAVTRKNISANGPLEPARDMNTSTPITG